MAPRPKSNQRLIGLALFHWHEFSIPLRKPTRWVVTYTFRQSNEEHFSLSSGKKDLRTTEIRWRNTVIAPNELVSLVKECIAHAETRLLQIERIVYMDKNLPTNLANPCKDPLDTPPHPDNRSRVLNQNNLSRDPNLSSDLIVMTYHAKELEPFQNLFLTSAHHPTQTKQAKSPLIGIQFVLFATNRRLEALWHSNKLFCSIKWKTRAAAAAWQTTSSLNLLTWKKRQTNNADLGTQRLLSLHDYSRDQRRTRRRRRSIPISGTTSSAIQWRSNAPSTGKRCTANSRNVAETFHREVSSTKKKSN